MLDSKYIFKSGSSFASVSNTAGVIGKVFLPGCIYVSIKFIALKVVGVALPLPLGSYKALGSLSNCIIKQTLLLFALPKFTIVFFNFVNLSGIGLATYLSKALDTLPKALLDKLSPTRLSPSFPYVVISLPGVPWVAIIGFQEVWLYKNLTSTLCIV